MLEQGGEFATEDKNESHLSWIALSDETTHLFGRSWLRRDKLYFRLTYLDDVGSKESYLPHM